MNLDLVLFLLAALCFGAAALVAASAPVRAAQLTAVGLLLAVALPPLLDAAT